MLKKNYKNFLLDMDGVLYHGKEPIQNAVRALELLHRLGKNVVFVTNGSSSSRAEIRTKLIRLGFKERGTEEHDVVTSSYAAAEVLRTRFPQVKRCYVIGEKGLMDEIALVSGCECLGGPDDSELKCATEEDFVELVPRSPRKRAKQIEGMMGGDEEMVEQHDSHLVDAVVVGWDRRFNYGKLCKASLYLERRPEIPLVFTNRDAYDHHPHGNWPGAGPIAAAVEAVLPPDSRVTKVLAGKPSRALVEAILPSRGFSKAETCIVGDRIDTDVRMGEDSGVDSFLVMTGVTKRDDPGRAEEYAALQSAGRVFDSLFHFVEEVCSSSSSSSCDDNDDGKKKKWG